MLIIMIDLLASMSYMQREKKIIYSNLYQDIYRMFFMFSFYFYTYLASFFLTKSWTLFHFKSTFFFFNYL